MAFASICLHKCPAADKVLVNNEKYISANNKEPDWDFIRKSAADTYRKQEPLPILFITINNWKSEAH